MYWIHPLWMFMISKYMTKSVFLYCISITDFNAYSFFASTCLACWRGPHSMSFMWWNNSNKHITLLHKHWFCLLLIACWHGNVSGTVDLKTMVLIQSNSAQDFESLVRLHQWRQAENTWVLWKTRAKNVRKQVDIALILSASNQSTQRILCAIGIFWTQTKKKKMKQQIFTMCQHWGLLF